MSSTARSYRSAVPGDLAQIASPELEVIGHLAEEGLDVRDRRLAMLVAELVRHDPAIGVADRATQRDRERPRAGPGFDDPRAREDVGVRHDRARRPSDTRPGRPSASSARSPRTGVGRPRGPCLGRSRRGFPPRRRSGHRVRACRCGCGRCRPPRGGTGTCDRADRPAAPRRPTNEPGGTRSRARLAHAARRHRVRGCRRARARGERHVDRPRRRRRAPRSRAGRDLRGRGRRGSSPSCSGSVTAVPSTETITSPWSMPAATAGPSRSVPDDVDALVDVERSSWNARSAVIGWVCTPRYPVAASGSTIDALDRVLHEVDLDRERDVLGGVVAGGVDADHTSAHVDERSARVPRVDRRIGLDHARVRPHLDLVLQVCRRTVPDPAPRSCDRGRTRCRS